ncbi:MAG: aquaporin family protein [Devosia nanyangense]|uniref:Aquaporin family protein n=1 Tax=Devosia nanyangense TaxID=1228055 RepID=A0A933NZ87_9HYPH|nr:aquaporin family protein [Devosia nanyangense]
MTDLARKLVAEGLGSVLLAATVIGSGLMAERLTGDTALMLLGNTLPTGAMLVVLITILGPISGAHFNPAVTAVFAARGDIGWREAAFYSLAQLAGAIAGTWLAHLMFAAPLFEVAVTARTGPSQWLSEIVAAFALLSTILAGQRFRPDALPWLIGLVIVAAYWFTASTSFANPALTLARSLTDSFAGIRPIDVPAFVVAQLVGAGLGAALMGWLLPKAAAGQRTPGVPAPLRR